MPRIPQSEIDRIKAEIDLVALVQSKGIKLEKHGSKDLKACCPFHDDKDASFIVTPSQNIFHCMGCGKAGSVYDFVMSFEGIGFHHAHLILADGKSTSLLRSGDPVGRSRVPKLDCPLALDAEDAALIDQLTSYYHERLKQSPAALEYLRGRGITSEAIEHFRIGCADNTITLRLLSPDTKDGKALRNRLKRIGLLREKSGQEHFNGCVVFPIRDEQGTVTEIYGRKIERRQTSGLHHLYLPGPHVGIFNRECLNSRDIILCEAVIDALTFWCAGHRNVTCIYGTEGFSEELWQAFLKHKTQRISIAYDRDDAGDRAAARDAEKFLGHGIEAFRVLFPHGMDANEYARKVTPADRSLRLLLNSAQWLGKGKAPSAFNGTPSPQAVPAIPEDISLVAKKLAANSEEPTPCDTSTAPTPTPPPEKATKEKKADNEPPPPREPSTPDFEITRHGEDIFLSLGERQYRVRGLDKNNSHEVLRVNLRLMVNGLFHVNLLDLYQAKQRQAFIDEAARETTLAPELIKRDLGKILLQLEILQEVRIREAMAPKAVAVDMSDADHKAAMELLLAPDLLDRILADFDHCGITGERTNKLAGYLAGVSRKLERPLAIIIQSTSAAGKTSLMESILAFMPKEERIKYSAMTGQSLFYLGEKDLKHKILAIVEEEGAEKASYALKLLQSEGELIIASTSKDESGRLRTEEYRVEGPVMIFLTTTAIDIDEELLNRCIVLTVDESRAQTEAIHRLQREAETVEGLRRKLDRERIIEVHRNAQRLLRSLYVVNPYAPRLTFMSERTRTRRDHMKYLILIRSIALLHQYQRPVKHLDNGTPYIEATLEDIAAANSIAHEVLGRSLDELPPQTRKLLGLLDAMVRQTCEKKKIGHADCRFSRRDVREYSGWSNTQLKLHLDRLADLEYLLPHTGRRGQSFVYELLFDGDVNLDRPQLIGLLDIASLRTDDDAKFTGPQHEFTWLAANNTGSNRPQNGAFSGPLRPDKMTATYLPAVTYELNPAKVLENHKAGQANENGLESVI